MDGVMLKCPICAIPMEYHEGEDEFSSDELHWYALWFCPKCGHNIRDYEDDFVFPGAL